MQHTRIEKITHYLKTFAAADLEKDEEALELFPIPMLFLRKVTGFNDLSTKEVATILVSDENLRNQYLELGKIALSENDSTIDDADIQILNIMFIFDKIFTLNNPEQKSSIEKFFSDIGHNISGLQIQNLSPDLKVIALTDFFNHHDYNFIQRNEVFHMSNGENIPSDGLIKLVFSIKDENKREFLIKDIKFFCKPELVSEFSKKLEEMHKIEKVFRQIKLMNVLENYEKNSMLFPMNMQNKITEIEKTHHDLKGVQSEEIISLMHHDSYLDAMTKGLQKKDRPMYREEVEILNKLYKKGDEEINSEIIRNVVPHLNKQEHNLLSPEIKDMAAAVARTSEQLANELGDSLKNTISQNQNLSETLFIKCHSLEVINKYIDVAAENFKDGKDKVINDLKEARIIGMIYKIHEDVQQTIEAKILPNLKDLERKSFNKGAELRDENQTFKDKILQDQASVGKPTVGGPRI